MWNDHSEKCKWTLTFFVAGIIAAACFFGLSWEGHERSSARAAQKPLKIIKLDGCEYVAPNGFISGASYFIHKANCSNAWHKEHNR